MTADEISPTERAILATIDRLKDPDGFARSIFQIADEAGIDYPWVHNRLKRLEALGLLEMRRRLTLPGRPVEVRRRC